MTGESRRSSTCSGRRSSACSISRSSKQIPAGRSHINMVVLIPGLAAAQPGRGALADVGGTNNLQNTTFSIHGGRTSDTRLQLDGVRLGNVLSGGEFSNFVPDTGSTQEVAVDYAAISAEQPFGGLRIDIIPREGGNSIRGVVFATYVNDAWQGSNLDQDLQNRGLPAPNEMKKAYDINPSVGGPILRDKLWFYTSARWQTNRELHRRPLLQQERGRPDEVDSTKRTRAAAASSRSSRTASTCDSRRKRRRSTRCRSTMTTRRATGMTRARVCRPSLRWPTASRSSAWRRPRWTAPLTNKLLFEARYALRGEAFGNQLPGEGDIYRDMIPVLEQSTNFFYRGKGGDGGVSGLFGYSSQNINTAVVSMSYVTGVALDEGRLQRHVGEHGQHVRLELELHDVPLQQRHPESGDVVRCADARRVAGQGRGRPLRAGPLDDRPLDA